MPVKKSVGLSPMTVFPYSINPQINLDKDILTA